MKKIRKLRTDVSSRLEHDPSTNGANQDGGGTANEAASHMSSTVGGGLYGVLDGLEVGAAALGVDSVQEFLLATQGWAVQDTECVSSRALPASVVAEDGLSARCAKVLGLHGRGSEQVRDTILGERRDTVATAENALLVVGNLSRVGRGGSESAVGTGVFGADGLVHGVDDVEVVVDFANVSIWVGTGKLVLASRVGACQEGANGGGAAGGRADLVEGSRDGGLVTGSAGEGAGSGVVWRKALGKSRVCVQGVEGR